MTLSTYSINSEGFVASLKKFVQEHRSDIFKDACAVMLTGSATLGFIDNPRDVDLSVILEPSLNVGPFGAGYINKTRRGFYRFDGYAVTLDFPYRRLTLDDYKDYTSL